VNKALSLALLACVLAGTWAFTPALRRAEPEHAQQVIGATMPSVVAAAEDPKPTETPEPPNQSLAVPPETTTILLPSRGTREEKGSPQSYRDREPVRLVRDIQRELKRVGCYAQEIDGDWTAGTRKAMRDFRDRMSAALPVERPDPAQLVLLQSQPQMVCRETCRVAGSADYRCGQGSQVADEGTRAAATTAGPLIVWTKSYVTPAIPEPDPVEAGPLAEAAPPPRPDPAPRPRRHTSRSSGGGLLFGLFGW